jgi:DNA mismatch repair protein PMS2
MGTEFIEVIDNGHGINPNSYDSIALKHHTSKLSQFSDLRIVQSFGFRGEALNALCELSGRFSIITKQAHQTCGSQLSFNRNGT